MLCQAADEERQLQRNKIYIIINIYLDVGVSSCSNHIIYCELYCVVF